MCLYWNKSFKEAILNSWMLNILYAVSITDSLDVGEEKLNAFIFPCSNGTQGNLQNRCIQITEGLIKTVENYAHYVKGGFSSEPRKEKHSVLEWKLFFFSPSIFVCRYVERFRWIQLRHWSSRTFQHKRWWLGWLLWLIYPWYFWNFLKHRKISSSLPYSNLPFDHCFSGPRRKLYARLIAKTNKVDSSQDG